MGANDSSCKEKFNKRFSAYFKVGFTELKIDVTPMEGFIPEQYNEILGLNKINLNAAVIATIGYRHEDDAAQHYAKVRKSNEELFLTL